MTKTLLINISKLIYFTCPAVGNFPDFTFFCGDSFPDSVEDERPEEFLAFDRLDLWNVTKIYEKVLSITRRT